MCPHTHPWQAKLSKHLHEWRNQVTLICPANAVIPSHTLLPYCALLFCHAPTFVFPAYVIDYSLGVPCMCPAFCFPRSQLPLWSCWGCDEVAGYVDIGLLGVRCLHNCPGVFWAT